MSPSKPILLIDDDEDDHEIIKAVCDKLGISDLLKHFTTGREFLSYLRSTPDAPFLILCDINMPGMNGLQVRSELVSDEKLRKKSIPFVFLSTSATNDQVQKAYDLTVQGFFTKGVSFQQTEQLVRKILEYWSDCKHPNTN